MAHRLSTIRNADRILYIDNKGIAEEGTHKELMEKRAYTITKLIYMISYRLLVHNILLGITLLI